MIQLNRVSRWYGQVIGVNDVSCQIGSGITALLGPNGAGKSTMMKLITGQIRPTTGQVTVFQERPFANTRIFKRLGYCPEIENSYDDMTGREVVTMLGALSGIPADKLRSRVAEAIERVGMTANADRKVGGYSKGMRQRIKIAQGIVHDPEILILDEPLNGLDPVGRRDVTQLLHELGNQGKCVVVSSHILYEVEMMTRNILLMSKGRLVAQGDIYAIRSLIDKHPHRIAIESPQARQLAKMLLDLPYVLSVKLDGVESQRLELETRQPDQFYAQFPQIVLDSNIRVIRFESPDNNLESVFSYLVNG